MYLEISARRTGKTTRLIEAFEKYGCSGYIIVPNQRMERLYPIEYRCQILSIGRLQNKDNWMGVERHKLPENNKLYWDEFEMCKGGSDFIKINDYYVTTPMYLRKDKDYTGWLEEDKDDMLLSLLYRTGRKYTKHNWDKKNDTSFVWHGLNIGQRLCEMMGLYEAGFEDYLIAKQEEYT